MTPPLFGVPALPTAGEYLLDGQEGHHAATVRRLRVGEQLLLGDGRGGLADCVVVSTAKDALTVSVRATRQVPAPRPRVVVVQALVKGDRGELAVELATEAGADEILAWQAARCVARWDDGPRGAKALARWQSTAVAAAKQARRAWTPEVRGPVGLAELTSLCAATPTLVLDADATTALADAELPRQGDLVLVVGPEGGVADSELAALTSAGALPVRLGPSVLRASTAAAVAIGALGVLTPRWRTQ